jgi:hypothetical protein
MRRVGGLAVNGEDCPRTAPEEAKLRILQNLEFPMPASEGFGGGWSQAHFDASDPGDC